MITLSTAGCTHAFEKPAVEQLDHSTNYAVADRVSAVVKYRSVLARNWLARRHYWI
jgi:hypothetical protein